MSLTLTKFEPMQGAPGEANYRNARLSYRISVAGKQRINLPTITFAIEAPNGSKLLERRLSAFGGAALDPGQSIDRTISLDPGVDPDWASVYAKTQNAKFTWSIDGQSSGSIEKPVHKPWP